MKRYLCAILLSFLFSLLFCLALIPVLRKLKAGQNILSYVKEHKAKGGTPTMGGIAFLFAATLTAALLSKRGERTFVLTVAIGVAYMVVGLLDDFLKLKRKENLGLRAWQKFFFQFLIALFAGIYCLRAGETNLYLPFCKKSVNVGWGILPLSAFVFIATVNAVNLTDGLDGLASAVSLPFFSALGIIISLQWGRNEYSLLCFALVGAILAYLLFNVSPASIFMGDTGSLSLGGYAAALAIFTGNALYIAVIGACFVFSVISVIAQVIYYKATGGKRIFLMAPVHHHFQKKGYSESKISYAYFTVTLLLGISCIIFLI